MKHLSLNPAHSLPPTRTHPQDQALATELPHAKEVKVQPGSGAEGGEAEGGEKNAGLMFVGTATVILEWEGNFLHAGDHVHLGPGVTGTRKTNPAIELHDLPRIDLVCLSHYHADHFDAHVESSLRRSLPIITTPHAKSHLASKGDGEAFTEVYDLDFFEDILVDIEGSKKNAAVKVTGMPGKHVPPGVLGTLNDLVEAVPPTNGWMIELGYKQHDDDDSFKCGYRIYVSGDTLLVPELKEIPKRYAGQNIDLMLIHLGGTTIPSPSVPLLMVTMDAEQGLGLVKLIDPDLTIPIHY
ncbi:MAG: hypothetical protein L6R42_006908, partial [Xanthoria sp. 1 TBL-2021]